MSETANQLRSAAEMDPPCPYCGRRMAMKFEDLDGWIACLECWGCEARGPLSEYKYADEDDAAEDAMRRFLAAARPGARPPDVEAELLAACRAIIDDLDGEAVLIVSARAVEMVRAAISRAETEVTP